MSTQRDPSLPSPSEIRYAVKRADFLLPEAKREALQALLRHKPIPTKEMLALFQAVPAARQWLERALYWSFSEQTRGYEGLPGGPGEIPARSLWKCPQCDFTWRVLRKGRPVPPCPRHGLELEPVLKERDDAG